MHWLKPYFHFTRKQTLAMVTIIVLALAFLIASWMLPLFVTRSFADDPALQQQLASLTFTDSAGEESPRKGGLAYADVEVAHAGTLFSFDPNTLSEDGFAKLGLRPKLVHTILNYRNKGGKFRSAAGMQKIYGMRPEEFARLEPYIKIAAAEKSDYPSTEGKRAYTPYNTGSNTTAHTVIDLNRADSAALERLPGIGPVLAGRVVKYRDKLGGFFNINQLAEVYGMPDSTFQQLKNQVRADESGCTKLNVNTASREALQKHPYIKYTLAKVLIAYREQHNDFKDMEELRRVALINEEIYRKIAPYLKVD